MSNFEVPRSNRIHFAGIRSEPTVCIFWALKSLVVLRRQQRRNYNVQSVRGCSALTTTTMSRILVHFIHGHLLKAVRGQEHHRGHEQHRQQAICHSHVLVAGLGLATVLLVAAVQLVAALELATVLLVAAVQLVAVQLHTVVQLVPWRTRTTLLRCSGTLMTTPWRTRTTLMSCWGTSMTTPWMKWWRAMMVTLSMPVLSMSWRSLMLLCPVSVEMLRQCSRSSVQPTRPTTALLLMMRMTTTTTAFMSVYTAALKARASLATLAVQLTAIGLRVVCLSFEAGKIGHMCLWMAEGTLCTHLIRHRSIHIALTLVTAGAVIGTGKFQLVHLSADALPCMQRGFVQQMITLVRRSINWPRQICVVLMASWSVRRRVAYWRRIPP